MTVLEKEISRINLLLDKLQFSNEDKNYFLAIIKPIMEHEEFSKRLDAQKFPHHGNTSLGSHIINDAVMTYSSIKSYNMGPNSTSNIDLKIAVIIAMFHDLYELPWQNSRIVKSKLVNKHGFTHPLEAVINSASWYPDYFSDEKSRDVIIDGIVHHMYPFPVRAITADFEATELNNLDKLNNLNKDIKNSLIKSSLRHRIGNISIARSKYPEGRIVSKADKIVAFGQDLNSLSDFKACITGVNSNLENYSSKLEE